MSAGEVGTSIGRALEVLGNGGLVAIPTETVYGLAADASNDAAVRRVFSAKGRPADHPLIVHVAAAEQLPEWAATVPPAAALLADACWPGPLTLLVPKAAHVLRVVTGGRDTVGVRVPAHPITTELLTRFGGGLAAPSANRFGKVSPTTAQHVAADLGTAVDYILDGGACPVGVESTIVDCSVGPPQLLRPEPSAWLLAHSDDLVLYARHLYDDLRAADRRGVQTIVAVLPPPSGLGHAIRDRLMKAAARW